MSNKTKSDLYPLTVGYEPLPRNEDYRWPMPEKRCAVLPIESDDIQAALADTLRDLTGRSALDLLEEWIKSQRDMPPATLEAFAMRISRHADEIERAERKITQMGREAR